MVVASSSGATRTGGCERGVLVVAKTGRRGGGKRKGGIPRKRSQESGGISGRTGETTLAVRL